MPTTLLLSCTKTKAPGEHPVPAGERYAKSRMFRAAIELAQYRGWEVLVLSARFGWVTLGQKITPYDQYMGKVYNGLFPLGSGYYFGGQRYFKNAPTVYKPLVPLGRSCGDQYSALLTLLKEEQK